MPSCKNRGTPLGQDDASSMTARRTLVVAAWEPELERFRDLADLARASRASASDEAWLHVETVGIGPVDTAALAMRCIVHHRPARVVLLGTCGAARSHVAIGDVIVGTRTHLVEPAVVEGRAAMPFAREAIALDPLGAASFGAREATIVNTLGITTDDALAATLAPLGDVEHLEAYGVARACQLATVPCTVILGVANVVGVRGRDQWRENHVAASAMAAEVAWRTLQSLEGSASF